MGDLSSANCRLLQRERAVGLKHHQPGSLPVHHQPRARPTYHGMLQEQLTCGCCRRDARRRWPAAFSDDAGVLAGTSDAYQSLSIILGGRVYGQLTTCRCLSSNNTRGPYLDSGVDGLGCVDSGAYRGLGPIWPRGLLGPAIAWLVHGSKW